MIRYKRDYPETFIKKVSGLFYCPFSIKYVKLVKNSNSKEVHRDNMNVSRMKNIIVLKDLPSNMVDEAIVILKKGCKVKDTELLENKAKSGFEEETSGNYDIVIKEAELVVQNYLNKLEKPAENLSKLKRLSIRYKKLKICSIILGVIAIIGIVISILK